MKKSIIMALLMTAASVHAYADSPAVAGSRPSLAIVAETKQADDAMKKVTLLQQEWARIKYQVGAEEKGKEMAQLSAEAAEVTKTFPDRAEPKIWQAIILSTEAGLSGGLGALSKAKDAKKLLEASLKIDPKALDGSASTSLGSLYYKVPGWPIGFGDADKAEQYLKAALAINPDGIDPNFFYGDYLIDKKEKYAEAIPFLEKALKAPDRPDRAVADAGRRDEIRTLLETAKKKSGGSTAKSRYN